MTGESRTITYGNVLPIERYARPLPTRTVAQIVWPEQWVALARRARCGYCGSRLLGTVEPSGHSPRGEISCLLCSRVVCELVAAPAPICLRCIDCGKAPQRRKSERCFACAQARVRQAQRAYRERQRADGQRDARNASRRERYREARLLAIAAWEQQARDAAPAARTARGVAT